MKTVRENLPTSLCSWQDRTVTKKKTHSKYLEAKSNQPVLTTETFCCRSNRDAVVRENTVINYFCQSFGKYFGKMACCSLHHVQHVIELFSLG